MKTENIVVGVIGIAAVYLLLNKNKSAVGAISTPNYWDLQFGKLMPFDGYGTTVKFSNTSGATNYMRITEESAPTLKKWITKISKY